MTEEKSSSSPSAATPAGNQNLIIGLVLGAVVLLLFFLVLQMTGGGFGGQSEVDKLKAERDARKEALAKVSSPGSTLGGQSAQALAARLSTDSATLADLVAKMQTMLAKTETDLKNANTLNQNLTQQLNNNSGQAAENLSLKNQLAQMQNRAGQAEALVASLQQQLNNAHTKAEMDTVRGQLEKALQARDSLQSQVAELNKQMRGMEASDIVKKLREDLATFRQKAGTLETENNKLIYEVQKLRAELDRTRLFVEKVDDLPAAAKALYVELSKLESATPAELKSEYERINGSLKASVVDQVNFPTGSSNVNRDTVDVIRRKVEAAGNESFFLVVGYASKSGGLEANKKLSSDRATRIASVTNFHKKSEQGVQAVFLSETSRFGPNLPANQVCEIWEIRK